MILFGRTFDLMPSLDDPADPNAQDVIPITALYGVCDSTDDTTITTYPDYRSARDAAIKLARSTGEEVKFVTGAVKLTARSRSTRLKIPVYIRSNKRS